MEILRKQKNFKRSLIQEKLLKSASSLLVHLPKDSDFAGQHSHSVPAGNYSQCSVKSLKFHTRKIGLLVR